jgi:hypothetical protein
VVGPRFIHARAAPGGRAGFLQFGALGDEADFGKAQENETEDRAGVFLGLQAGVGAELVGGIPAALSVSFSDGAIQIMDFLSAWRGSRRGRASPPRHRVGGRCQRSLRCPEPCEPRPG